MIERLSGRRNQARRQRLFRREPLCRHCSVHGRVALATELDHVIPLYKGGSDTEDNTQPLCHACHYEKSQQDMNQRSRATTIQGLDW